MAAMYENLMVGTEVMTSDGEKLGEVKEVHNGAFKVAAKLQPDYWLNTTCVISVQGHTATVSFAKDDLSDYKLERTPDQ
jgi:hypothetical protein